MLPGVATIGEPFSVTATLYNEQYRDQAFNVSAYVYRGSKNYTPREPREIIIDSFSEEGISFELSPDLEPGEYFVKIKAVKEGRKTPYEERRTLVFSAPPEPIVQVVEKKFVEEVEQEVVPESDALVPITGSVLAEPPKKKNKLWVSLVLAGVLLLLSRVTYSRT